MHNRIGKSFSQLLKHLKISTKIVSHHFQIPLYTEQQCLSIEWWTESLKTWTITLFLPFFCPHTFVYHSITEPRRWEGPQEVSSPASCLKQGQPWFYTRLCGALSNRALKTIKDRAPTALLGAILHYSCRGNFFYIVRMCPASLYDCCLHYCEEPGSTFPFINHPGGTNRLLLGSTKATSSPGSTSCSLSLPSQHL